MIDIFTEDFSPEAATITGEGDDKKYFIEGVFIHTGVKNNNNRIYPKSVVLPEVQRINDNLISRSHFVGELGHPHKDMVPQINPERVSHNIEFLAYTDPNNEDGDFVYGKARLLGTPYGNIAKKMIDENILLAVSTRAATNSRVHLGTTIVTAMKLVSVDIVFQPGADAAFMTALKENEDWAISSGILPEEELKGLMETIDSDARAGGVLFAENNIFLNLDKILSNVKS